MLPPVILMHRLKSSHSESHSGGAIELPSRGLLGGFLQKSMFYEHFLFSPRAPPPSQGPPPTGSTDTRQGGGPASMAMAPAQGTFPWSPLWPLLLGFAVDFLWIS